MSATPTAAFAQLPKSGFVTVTDAVETSIGTVGVNGALLTSLTALPNGTVTASRLRLLVSKDSGVTLYPVRAVTMTAYTEDTAAAPELVDFATITEDTPLRIEAGWELYVVSDVAQAAGVTFTAEWTDF